MGQSAWTITTSRGKRFNVGLYHGEQSGHLVVHVNNAITLIDFGITETKDYRFFIEEDLCELKINRQDDTYSYNFALDQEADTPLNRRRKSNSRTDRNLVLKGIAGVVFAAILMISLSNFSKAPEPETRAEFIELLASSRGYPQTEVRFYKPENASELHFSYRIGTQIYDGLFVDANPPIFPLEEGDAFEIRYLYDQPDLFYIDYSLPKEETLMRQVKLAANTHASLHPELSKNQISCQIALAFELHQFAGVAELYYQQKEEEWAHPFNKNAYLRLLRSPEFSQRAKGCL